MFTMFAVITLVLMAYVTYAIYKSDTQAEQDYGFSETPGWQPQPKVLPVRHYTTVVLGIEEYNNNIVFWCMAADGEEFSVKEISKN